MPAFPTLIVPSVLGISPPVPFTITPFFVLVIHTPRSVRAFALMKHPHSQECPAIQLLLHITDKISARFEILFEPGIFTLELHAFENGLIVVFS